MKNFKSLSNNTKKIIIYCTYLVFICLVCVASFATYNRFYYSFYYVEGYSMYPTLEPLQFGKVDTHRDILQYLDRFDIVITYYPTDYNDNELKNNAELKIKRVIGLPNETITITNSNNQNYINVNGIELVLPFNPDDNLGLDRYVGREYILKDNEYFLMGDNWGHSSDSCDVGPININMVQGILIAIEGICDVDSGGNVISLTYQDKVYFK